MRKLLAPPTALSALLLAPPAPAAAASTDLVTHPVTVDGYTMRIVAETGDAVSVTLFRRVEGSIQQHTWEADHRFRLTGSRSLHRGLLRTRFGTRGQIKMKFRARGRASRGRVPWCTERGRRISAIACERRAAVSTGMVIVGVGEADELRFSSLARLLWSPRRRGVELPREPGAEQRAGGRQADRAGEHPCAEVVAGE